jgi:hypothetical protein
VTELRTEYLKVGSLIPNPWNPKKHRLDHIDKSFDEFGYVEPVVMDERTGQIVAGHGRVEQLIARQLEGKLPPDGVFRDAEGDWCVPVTRGWSSRDDAHASAYLVASNRLTEVGGWDDRALVTLLDGLDDGLLEPIGFTTDDLEDLRFLLELPSGLGVGESVSDRAAEYAASGVRSLTLPFAVKDWEEALVMLEALRKKWSLESNSLVITRLLVEAVGDDND